MNAIEIVDRLVYGRDEPGESPASQRFPRAARQIIAELVSRVRPLTVRVGQLERQVERLKLLIAEHGNEKDVVDLYSYRIDED